MSKSDVIQILSVVVGISSLAADAVFGTELNRLFGSAGPIILASLGAAGIIAEKVMSTLQANSNSAAKGN